MRQYGRGPLLMWIVFCPAALLLSARGAFATEILLQDGRILRGKLGVVASLADVPQPPGEGGMIQLITLLDDDLRRVFFPKRLVQEVRQDNPGKLEEKFDIRQRVLRAGRAVKSVGPVLRIQPFDEFGRRIFTMNTTNGPVDIIQGITLITPKWTKVEGISHIWDMRIATSSIPRDVLHKILMRQIDEKDVEHRKKIARFYLQTERYKEAQEELEKIVKDFPDRPNLKEELAPTIRTLAQLGAQRLLSELQARKDAGQHRLVLSKLNTFPSEDVAGEILQAVREMAQQYAALQNQGRQVIDQLNVEIAKIKDDSTRESAQLVRDEIVAELNIDTLDRMAAFLQNVGDSEILPEEKVALAISGWLIGSDDATLKLPVAISLYRVRRLVREYLAEPIKLNRARVLSELVSEEGATPQLVAGLIAQMKPPMDPPDPITPEWPGYYKLQVPGLPKEPPISYLVQLPPEYDPYRRYPTVLTLHGSRTTAAQQIDWFAGAWVDGQGWRSGQAGRQGYIVIAPEWASEHQTKYGYTAREHAAVLNSLRDASRRFSIDTDRVFLSGHSMGGDAAWDIALAHPDLWAGVIPIVAQADRYCSLYWENAERVPFYIVCGELDGAKLTENARDIDRYMKRGFNCTVVEYLGRGHEHFYDEVLEIFDWMGRFRRDFFPREFECVTMRSWDNFFWWVEMQGMPPRSMVDPVNWPPPRGSQPVQIRASIHQNNGINIRAGTSLVTVWVSPKMLDFEQRASIVINGRRANSRDPFIQPDLEVLLEDVRTRGDRQNPFWAKVEATTGRTLSSR